MIRFTKNIYNHQLEKNNCMHKNTVYIFSFFIIALVACNNSNQTNNTSSDSTKTDSNKTVRLIPSAKNFQSTIDGKQTNLYVLKNGNMQVAVTNYGARVVSIIVPDKNGNATDVSVGYDA